ncbi:uncharacterized protein LOC116412097 [Xenopus tropicalis]|uniref:Uncharacterized protein LOC116412097 n=1 Tax=Xenopus tropicalis TaxID=8364 RepID=A0A8J1JWT3_XENTR|nr:uncharacterized protein LOC116412097 [Xenopus tropicalis]
MSFNILLLQDLIAMSANTAEKYDYIPRNAWVFEEQQISDMDLHGQKAKETEDVPPLEAFIVSESESIPKAKDVIEEREVQTPPAIPAVLSDPSSDTDKSVTPKSQKDCEEEKPQDGEDNVQEASAEKASKPRSIVQPNPVEEKEQKEESKKEIPADVVQVVKEREAQTPAEPSAIPPDPSPGDSNAKKPMSRDQWYAQMNEMTKEINSALKYTTLKPRIKTTNLRISIFNVNWDLVVLERFIGQNTKHQGRWLPSRL